MPATTSPSPVEIAHSLRDAIAPRAAEADRTGKLPREDVEALTRSGYLGINIPKAYGGFGLPMRECLELHIELAKGSASTALVASMPLQLIGHQREVESWPDDLMERLCHATPNEGALFNSVASEPVMGSPSRGGSFATTALPDEERGGWIVNGEKTWVTGGAHLTHLLVKLTVIDTNGLVLIPGDADGLTWQKTWGDALSLRASDSHTLILENVHVPPENLIFKELPKDPHGNGWFPTLIGAVYLGTAFAARDAVIQYALERVPTALGKPIATLPGIQREIGQIDLALQSARALLYEVAAEWEAHPNDRPALYTRIGAAKIAATEAAAEVTDKALRIAGAGGIGNALPLERYFRDARAGLTHPPSGETGWMALGKAAIEGYSKSDG